jgi:hypothetical protein
MHVSWVAFLEIACLCDLDHGRSCDLDQWKAGLLGSVSQGRLFLVIWIMEGEEL